MMPCSTRRLAGETSAARGLAMPSTQVASSGPSSGSSGSTGPPGVTITRPLGVLRLVESAPTPAPTATVTLLVTVREGDSGSRVTVTPKTYSPGVSMPEGSANRSWAVLRRLLAGEVAGKQGRSAAVAQVHRKMKGVGLPSVSTAAEGSSVATSSCSGAPRGRLSPLPPWMAAAMGSGSTASSTSADAASTGSASMDAVSRKV
mmetsp:Transcript_35410/g.89287  ORF Transcript_35410/g.89287 Transcript_35410/m.89287 type:complete len:203 (-) Transcript_35410:504-1112(-)